MSVPPDFDRIARAWLADGPTELADRVLDNALAEIHTTRQRRRPAAARRFAQMSTQARIGLAAATVIVAVVVGSVVLRSGDKVPVGADVSPSATTSASPTTAAPAAVSIAPATGPRVTMNDKGCYGENLGALRAGSVAIEAVSTTQDGVQWDLLSYAAPHTWPDVAAVVIERQQGVAAGSAAGGAADWMQHHASAETGPTARSKVLQSSLPVGQYLIVCVGVAPDSSNTGVFVVGPIDVKP